MRNTTKTREIEQLEKTIAELRQKIEILKQSSAAQLKQIGENLPEGGFYQLVHEPDGNRYCSYVSDRFGRLFQTDNDLIKKDVHMLYSMFLPEHVEHVERVARLEQESLERMDRFDLEAPMRLPDGQIRWFQWHSKPKRSNGGLNIWDGVCLDITRRKKAEEALRRMRDDLENRVQRRTADLLKTNKALEDEIESRKQAEKKLRKALSEIERLKNQLEAECTYLHEEIKQVHDYGHIIGESEVMKYVLYSMERIAPTDSTVLILGESGTGKELIARAIHHHSKRSQRPLVKVDCAALPANLIESELFGHEKGAFTDAAYKRIGRFELADGATLFLDEIGELPLELQKKLLRVLQDGEYERLGSATVMHTDVRIIAATNRDLETDVRRGRFREDLWFRLNVLQLSLPPLRDRKGDIPLLVEWIVNKVQRRLGRQIRRIPDAFMEALNNYSWPGNVRELENVIERAMVFSHGDALQLAAPLVKTTAASPSAPSAAPLKPLAEVEKDHILRALESTLWKISGKGGAAEILGINASTLRGRMLKHGIRRPSAHS